MAAYTTIDDPSAHFQVATYTGNGGSDRAVVNDGNSAMQPDWVWYKSRSHATSHITYDSTRGDGPYLKPSDAGDEGSDASMFESFDSDGFSLNADTDGNGNGRTYVAWQWKANGGTTTSVSASGTGEASINASTHQVNAAAGFSIVSYTGRDDQISNGQETKLTHGLGVVPSMMICKKLNANDDWFVLGKNATETNNWYWSYNEFLNLNETTAVNGVNYTGNKQPDSTYIYLGNAKVNTTDNWIAYCFAEKQGYSKFGRYKGNGNASGPFVYTGFKPAFVMVKIIDTHGGSAGEWQIYDHKRPGYNFPNYNLSPNNTAVEYTGESYHNMDFLSNGFKILLTDVAVNTTGKLYGYMAFAERPFVTSTGTPTTAR